jgi:hypothetical protein
MFSTSQDQALLGVLDKHADSTARPGRRLTVPPVSDDTRPTHVRQDGTAEAV